MNKNIKRIIAISLAIGTVSVVAPTSNVNLLTTKAYASSSADELDDLVLLDDDDESVDLYKDDDYEDEVDGDGDDLDEGETYYAQTSSSAVVIDSIDGANDDNVRIFKGSFETDYEVGEEISLSSGTTTLKIRVYEDEYDDYDDYDDANDSDYNEYKIEIDNTDDDDDENDEDTLDSLELLDKNDDNIDFYEGNDYEDEVDIDDVDEGETYYAKTSSDEISMEIEGPDEDYIKIFKSTSDSAKGKNPGDNISISEDVTLTVRIYEEEPDSDVTYEEDDDVIGEYEIKLEYTGDKNDSTSADTATNTESTATNVVTTTVNSNKWVQVNGRWQYNDAAGNLIKNSWFYDRNYGKSYYLDSFGNMATGWLYNNAKWYYVGNDGGMKTGWQNVDGTWYYLDSEGVMASDTIINGYYLDSHGAWIR